MMKRTVATLALSLAVAGAAFAADAPEAYSKKCKACHSVGGAGGAMAKMGGPLDDAASKHDEAWLRAYLKDPKSKMPEAKMPKLTLSDPEWDAVVAYILSLKK